jgi:hypothetical protein
MMVSAALREPRRVGPLLEGCHYSSTIAACNVPLRTTDVVRCRGATRLVVKGMGMAA